MKITIHGPPKEIAAFVLAIQKRQDAEEEDPNALIDAICDTLAEHARLSEKHQPLDLLEGHEPV